MQCSPEWALFSENMCSTFYKNLCHNTFVYQDVTYCMMTLKDWFHLENTIHYIPSQRERVFHGNAKFAMTVKGIFCNFGINRTSIASGIHQEQDLVISHWLACFSTPMKDKIIINLMLESANKWIHASVVARLTDFTARAGRIMSCNTNLYVHF